MGKFVIKNLCFLWKDYLLVDVYQSGTAYEENNYTNNS